MCFFFNETATTEIYTLSLHDALPICLLPREARIWALSYGASHDDLLPYLRSLAPKPRGGDRSGGAERPLRHNPPRSEEHTSELQSRQYLVCRLLLEKKTNTIYCLQHK